MERIPVSSSNVASIGYDPDSKTLEIEFNNGSVYLYSEVPTEDYEGLMSSDSKGKYIHARIKQYPCTRM